jgi:hypothetical protein
MIGLLVLAAATPLSTSTAVERARAACVLHRRNQDETSALLQCFPFSSPTKVRGVWITGFEFQRFFQDRATVPSEWARSPKHPKGLSFPSRFGSVRAGHPNGKPRAYRITLIGRRSLAPIVGEEVIAVGRVISMQRLQLPRER